MAAAIRVSIESVRGGKRRRIHRRPWQCWRAESIEGIGSVRGVGVQNPPKSEALESIIVAESIEVGSVAECVGRVECAERVECAASCRYWRTRGDVVPVAGIGERLECAATCRNGRMRLQCRRKDWRMVECAARSCRSPELENAQRHRSNWKMHRIELYIRFGARCVGPECAGTPGLANHRI